MNKLVDILNALADMDWGWWPLLRYRPPKHKDIDSVVILKLTPYFGTLTGLLIAYSAQQFNMPVSLIIYIGIGWFSFFILYRVAFAPAWNSRARKLRQNGQE